MLPFLFICCLLVICVKFPCASSLSCSFNFSKTREPCHHELEYLSSLSSPIEENTSISLLTSITNSSTKFPSGGNQRTLYHKRYTHETMHIPFLSSDGPSDGNSTALATQMFADEAKIQYNQTCDVHPLDPITYDLCTSYHLGALQSLYHRVLVQPIASCNRYYTPKSDDNHSGEVSSRSTATKSVGFGQAARKMLRGNDRRMLERSRGLRPRIPVLDRKKQHPFRTAAIAVALALLGLLLAGVLMWCNWNKSKAEVRTELCPSAPRRYSHNELAVATQMFADEAKIGRGGFGPVYRGYLCDQNRHVAIKVLSQGSSVQGEKEFEAEVRVMTKLRHRNIVELIGWCDGPGRDLLLVYQFMPNGSLDKHLYNPQRVLTWSDRYKIVLGVGSAILYLHTECEQCVVHGDIKPANIMLDASCNPKLGDFGLARLVDHEADPQTTQIVAGTVGYIDPAFVNSRRPRAESDVYSFGVVLLETACGRRPSSTQQSSRTLVNWVRDMYRQDSILAVADRRLDAVFDGQQLTRVLVAGLWCTHQDQNQRPSIAQAMDALRREHAELPVFGSEMHIAEAVGSYGDFSGGEDSHESPAQTEYLTSEET